MTRTIRLEKHEDIRAVLSVLDTMAKEARIPTTAYYQVVLAIREMAVNQLKYADRGSISLAWADDAGDKVLEVVAEDQGPGIADLHQALKDGFSTDGGLGLGLGAISRLMDEMAIESTPETGTRIVARKRVPRQG